MTYATEFHVSASKGDDNADGSDVKSFKAMSGDTITIHEGVHRKRDDPPRGGVSDAKRITYQAARVRSGLKPCG